MSRRKLDVDRTRERLLDLGLAHAADQLEPVLSEAVKEGQAPHAVLDTLLDVEHQAREGRRVRTALRLSSLPTGQTLADFDFAFQPALERSRIDLRKRVAVLPDTKNGEARSVPLTERAVAVIRALPTPINSPRLFPRLTTEAVKRAYIRACKRAGIENLHFHDLRHEATSRLFEMGLNPMEVAAITGHKTLQMLKRYTHLNAADLARKLR